MKIEKINDNQIRCTLTREDLENHQIRISELAYGTEKAKKLFRDMMQQAQIQFGFEADNIPLMIEAIPVSTESIILIITKVEDPLNGYFTGTNTLYKDPADELYKLVLHQSSLSPEDFNRVCNILTEYGQGKAFSLSGEAYLTEHGELISDSALQQLIQL